MILSVQHQECYRTYYSEADSFNIVLQSLTSQCPSGIAQFSASGSFWRAEGDADHISYFTITFRTVPSLMRMMFRPLRVPATCLP